MCRRPALNHARCLTTDAENVPPKEASLTGNKRRQRKNIIFEDHPSNESTLHYKTKAHLSEQLAKTASLSILKPCASKSDPDAPAVFPYWSCNNTKEEKNWISGWNVAKMEYSRRGIGKFDLALLRKEEAREPHLVGVVEVLVSSPMTTTKVAQLAAHNIPWIEVQASVDLFRDKKKLLRSETAASRQRGKAAPPKAWEHKEALSVIGTSDGPWTCNICKELAATKKENLLFESIAGIVDVYCSATTRHGQGQLRRKVFGIYRVVNPAVWSEPERLESSHYFLVVGTALSTTNRLGFDTLPIDSKLLISTHSISGYANNGLPKEIFHQHMLDELRREQSADAGAIFDFRLDWPGSSLSDFFTQYDPMSSLVSVQGIKSIGKLHGSLSRIVGFRYRFDKFSSTWVPSRNHKAQPL